VAREGSPAPAPGAGQSTGGGTVRAHGPERATGRQDVPTRWTRPRRGPAGRPDAGPSPARRTSQGGPPVGGPPAGRKPVGPGGRADAGGRDSRDDSPSRRTDRPNARPQPTRTAKRSPPGDRAPTPVRPGTRPRKGHRPLGKPPAGGRRVARPGPPRAGPTGEMEVEGFVADARAPWTPPSGRPGPQGPPVRRGGGASEGLGGPISGDAESPGQERLARARRARWKSRASWQTPGPRGLPRRAARAPRVPPSDGAAERVRGSGALCRGTPSRPARSTSRRARRASNESRGLRGRRPGPVDSPAGPPGPPGPPIRTGRRREVRGPGAA